MYYRMKVAGLERDLPICPVNDKLYIAGFVYPSREPCFP